MKRKSKMIIYEVNIDVHPTICEAYKIWLATHVKHMVTFEGFIEAKILQDQTNPNMITCIYAIDSQASLDNYLTHHAPAMRQDGINRFGNQFSIARRIFEVSHVYFSENKHQT